MTLAELCRPLVGRFGIWAGLGVAYHFRQAMWAGRPGVLTTMRIPGWRQPVYLRNRTSDALVLWQVLVDRQADFPMVREPRVIVDAGANIGLVSVALANRFPSARIVALELATENVGVLLRNVSAYPQVQPMAAALWPHTGHVAVVNPEATGWAFHAREADEASPGAVPAISMSDLMTRARLDRVDLLKIDIEGGEYDLFASGALAWLDHVEMVVIELHESMRPGVTALVDEALGARGFSPVGTWGEYAMFVRGVQLPAPSANP